MASTPGRAEPASLRLEWRRGLVVLGGAAAAAALIVAWSPGAPARIVHGVQLVAATVGVGVLWFLADCLHPWLADPDDVGPEERAHADAAVRRAYSALFVMAFIALLLEIFADGQTLASGRPEAAVVNLVLGAILLMPIATAAWTAPVGGFAGSPVGPVELVRRRFRGPSALPYAVGALAATMVVPMLVVAMRPPTTVGDGWSRWSLVAALVVALVCGWLLLRVLLEHSLNRSDSHRH